MKRYSVAVLIMAACSWNTVVMAQEGIVPAQVDMPKIYKNIFYINIIAASLVDVERCGWPLNAEIEGKVGAGVKEKLKMDAAKEAEILTVMKATGKDYTGFDDIFTKMMEAERAKTKPFDKAGKCVKDAEQYGLYRAAAGV